MMTRGQPSSRGTAAQSVGGFCPGCRFPLEKNILLWWQPGTTELFGYEDGWTAGDTFYFSGTGQEGNQGFEAPYSDNRRVRDHEINRERLRLLRCPSKNRVRYVPNFESMLRSLESGGCSSTRSRAPRGRSLALGQLLDYGRWLQPRPRLCVLVPSEPPLDLLGLLEEQGIEVSMGWRRR